MRRKTGSSSRIYKDIVSSLVRTTVLEVFEIDLFQRETINTNLRSAA